MLFIIGNRDDLFKAQSHISQDIFIKIFDDITIMDAIYGEHRDYLSAGGYSLVVQTEQDLLTVLKITVLIHLNGQKKLLMIIFLYFMFSTMIFPSLFTCLFLSARMIILISRRI